ncbi:MULTISPECIES: heme o synthase [Limnochorda]|uniref:heme o synthase n=1 Tax=Limnochorda TaxID=1676651 RepID=UPI0017D7A627|nr:heme o synthase [Limnochorda pilosa]NMA70713.1 protoheme IX farnesyltransferase [Bacillota bacterium]
MATTAVRATGTTTSLRDYIALTKPRHVLPSTLTTWVGMALAAPGPLPARLVAATLAGTALAIAGAHVYNAILDRDLDGLMDRTRHRPLPSGRVAVWQAAVWGTVLSAASLAIMLLLVNGLAALLTVAGIFLYVVVYTFWLKRRSPWNTLAGGFSGGAPPLIGWAAASGSLSWAAGVLFGIMVVWQPLHFFALSLKVADDYRRAGFPMVVVVHGEQATLNQIVVYSLILAILAPLFTPLGVTGTAYLVVALALSGIYVAAAVRAAREGPARAKFWGTWLLRYAFIDLTLLLVTAVLNRTV